MARRVAAGHGYVIRVNDPIMPAEQLQLMAARLQRTPIMIAPQNCKTVEEWVTRYGERGADR